MNATSTSTIATPSAGRRGDIVDWRPEDNEFWETTGKRIAYRNLALSVPALLCGFAVWGMWGIITVQMLNLGFPFTQAELFTLTAIAGIAGALPELVVFGTPVGDVGATACREPGNRGTGGRVHGFPWFD